MKPLFPRVSKEVARLLPSPIREINNQFYYHDNNTGNLTKFQDGLGNTWQYVWTNNNLTQTQDAKGTTTYQYDSRGNVTSQTTTVDGNPGNNITKTMTYDDYNQLLEVVDGSGRKTSYRYSNQGNLLSTSNPDLKESNGRKYDQYGNTIEYSPAVLGDHNLLKNGSMEIAGTGGNLLANWTRIPGAATVSREGFNSHGNSALNLTSTTATTDWFYQAVSGVNAGDKLTLKLTLKLKLFKGQMEGLKSG
jgi:YD repeat-containing protein